jgi:hypothetical protein
VLLTIRAAGTTLGAIRLVPAYANHFYSTSFVGEAGHMSETAFGFRSQMERASYMRACSIELRLDHIIVLYGVGTTAVTSTG